MLQDKEIAINSLDWAPIREQLSSRLIMVHGSVFKCIFSATSFLVVYAYYSIKKSNLLFKCINGVTYHLIFLFID